MLLDQNFCSNLLSIYRNEISEPKPKSKKKKKPKKGKFKSLKKGSLSSEVKPAKQEAKAEPMSIEDDVYSHEELSYSDIMSSSNIPKKRKKVEVLDAEEGKSSKKKSKKFKKPHSELHPLDWDLNAVRKKNGDCAEIKPSKSLAVENEQKSASRSKTGGKISITSMPVKRVLMIKPEKLKKGNIWSRDCAPSPDSWLPQEDAVLCAVVHEYGPHWSLVSETLYSMTAGGFYRGRYRHPVHCCERFRELIQRHILAAPDTVVNERMSNAGSGKALLKVTEVKLSFP